MINRLLQPKIVDAATDYPVVTLTGPRQSGKTTLVRHAFPKHAYTSLEAPDTRQFALEDPRGFLDQFEGGVILDEIQNAPELPSYIQGRVDERKKPGEFILTGSQHFALMERVTQSLAGRTALFHLLPLSRAEIEGRKTLLPSAIGSTIPRRQTADDDLFAVMFAGFYPRVLADRIEPHDWLRNYYRTYVERDVRQLVNVGDIERFSRFVRLCAGRAGQLLNASSLGADCGITHDTARRWISVLEAGFIVHLLRPHFKNFSKRLIKSPKLYFYDTGLLCFLLGIRKPDELVTHPLRGAIFENFVLGELLKAYANAGEEPGVFFWRDSAGHEVDIVIDHGDELVPVEIKSGATIAADYFQSIAFWRTLTGDADRPAAIVYGGDTSMRRNGVAVYSWRHWL